MSKIMFNTLAMAVLIVLFMANGCTPAKRVAEESAPGTFLAARNKLYSERDVLDIRDTIVYPSVSKVGLQNPSTSVSDQDLTMYRCSWCHECGFEAAWDWDNFGNEDWLPRYTGEEWAPVVERMMNKEDSLLQEEQIVIRIYNYLRDETLGVYNLDEDDKGAIRIEVDELPVVQSPDVDKEE